MSIESSTPSKTADEMTMDRIRDERDELIQEGFDCSEVGLIDALPVSGKSYGVIKWARETEENLTVLAPRHELLDDYESLCEEFELDSYRIPSFYRDCGCFAENDDNDYVPVNRAAQKLNEDYQRGLGGKSLHSQHSKLPCQDKGECRFITRKDVDTSEYDVLLGTYRHAKAETWIDNRYVAFDEFPGDAFLRSFDDGIASIVSAYVNNGDNQLPFDSFTEVVFREDDPTVRQSIEGWKDSLSHRLKDYGHARKSPNPSAHALAPMATLALIDRHPLDNGWGYSNLQNGKVGVHNPKDDKWTFLRPPDLSHAESVIGLDGTPNEELWEIVLGEEITRLELIEPEDRREYLQDVLGYTFVQTTENWKAIEGDAGPSPPKELALIEGISQRHGRPPAFISSQEAIYQYESRLATESTRLDSLIDAREHYHDLKGLNNLGNKLLGLVVGHPQPSDDVIEKWSALAGKSAERKEVDGERTTGNDTDFGPFGNRVLSTFVHDEVFQAAMRFGREVTDQGGATVYLHTSALPNWLPVEKQIADIQSWLTEKNGMKDTLGAIRSLDEWKNKDWISTELYNLTSISERRVRDCLDDLAEKDFIMFEGNGGRNGAKQYTNIRLDEAGQIGDVVFRN